jgi:hypothetical protein
MSGRRPGPRKRPVVEAGSKNQKCTNNVGIPDLAKAFQSSESKMGAWAKSIHFESRMLARQGSTTK